MPRPSVVLPWLREQVASAGEACILWPFAMAKTARHRAYPGTPTMRYDGGTRKATHVVLILVGRQPPQGADEVRHTCNTARCVNPNHLVVGTHRENADDRLGFSAPLSVEQIRAIRAEPARRGLHAELARTYGVSHTTVYNIRTGKRWAHLA